MKNISYNDFKQLDIRIVEVIGAESIPHKNRILKLAVDIGSDETRTHRRPSGSARDPRSDKAPG